MNFVNFVAYFCGRLIVWTPVMLVVSYVFFRMAMASSVRPNRAAVVAFLISVSFMLLLDYYPNGVDAEEVVTTVMGGILAFLCLNYEAKRLTRKKTESPGK